MSTTIEVHTDVIRNLIAVAWPTRRGYTIYGEHGEYEDVHVLPAGMVRLQEPAPAPTAPTATSSATSRPRPAEASVRPTVARGA